MAILALFDQNQIAPIFEEKQGYSMAIFALFDQNQIAPILMKNKAIVWLFLHCLTKIKLPQF